MGLCLKRDCASLGSLTVPVKPVVLRENSLLCGGDLADFMLKSCPEAPDLGTIFDDQFVNAYAQTDR
jgi:hypothetical protein